MQEKLKIGSDKACIHQGLLYLNITNSVDGWRLIVPKSLTRKVISEIHQAGHFGIQDVIYSVRVYWRPIKKIIKLIGIVRFVPRLMLSAALTHQHYYVSVKCKLNHSHNV